MTLLRGWLTLSDLPLVKYYLYLNYFIDEDTNDYYTPEEIIAYFPDILSWKVTSSVMVDKIGRTYALINC